jgi:hypothetical protein
MQLRGKCSTGRDGSVVLRIRASYSQLQTDMAQETCCIQSDCALQAQMPVL